MATDDDDAATLRERVRELEQTVAQQQDTIQQLMPSRRAILAGGAGLVGGAALTGQASAQSAAGQVGTSSEPVDVEAATVSADSVNTDDLGIGSADFVSVGDFAGIGLSWNSDAQIDLSTTSSSYTTDLDFFRGFTVWDDCTPSDATTAIYSFVFGGGGSSNKDIRLRNVTDDENVWEVTGRSGLYDISRTDTFSPTTTGSKTEYNIEVRDNSDRGVEVYHAYIVVGVQL